MSMFWQYQQLAAHWEPIDFHLTGKRFKTKTNWLVNRSRWYHYIQGKGKSKPLNETSNNVPSLFWWFICKNMQSRITRFISALLISIKIIIMLLKWNIIIDEQIIGLHCISPVKKYSWMCHWLGIYCWCGTAT